MKELIFNYLPEILVALTVSFILFIIRKIYTFFSFNELLAYEHTDDLRKGIHKCKEVMRLVSSSGGMVQHPWKTEIGVVKEDELANHFSRFEQRIKNSKIKESSAAVRAELRRIFAANVVQSPILFFDDKNFYDGKTPEDREFDIKKSKIQLDALDRIESELPIIEAFLGKIERRTARVQA